MNSVHFVHWILIKLKINCIKFDTINYYFIEKYILHFFFHLQISPSTWRLEIIPPRNLTNQTQSQIFQTNSHIKQRIPFLYSISTERTYQVNFSFDILIFVPILKTTMVLSSYFNSLKLILLKVSNQINSLNFGLF